MSIRGVSFRIEQKLSCVLWNILKCIDIKKYYWYIINSQNEIWDSSLNNNFFELDIYDGESFFDRIHNDHRVIFLKLQAYLDYSDFSNISTYKDFYKSTCLFLFLLYDCEFVEIYSKNDDITRLLYNNAKKNRYKDVIYITDKNDGRVGMDIQ